MNTKRMVRNRYYIWIPIYGACGGQAGVGSNLTGYLRYLRLLLLKEKVKRMIIMSKRKAVNNQGIVL